MQFPQVRHACPAGWQWACTATQQGEVHATPLHNTAHGGGYGTEAVDDLYLDSMGLRRKAAASTIVCKLRMFENTCQGVVTERKRLQACQVCPACW